MVRVITKSSCDNFILSNSIKQYIKDYVFDVYSDDPNIDISDIAIFLAGDLEEQGLVDCSSSSLISSIQHYISEIFKPYLILRSFQLNIDD